MISLQGIIMKGYGKSDTLLEFPTSNITMFTISERSPTVNIKLNKPLSLDRGVYYGWSKVNLEKEYSRMIMNVYSNP